MSQARGSFGLLSIVALAGAGTMVVELAAVRVLAPWFGTSSAVWTNVIGVVLLALALGYLAGSRLAIRPGPMRTLGWALLVAALVISALPAAAGPVADYFHPQGGTLDRASDLLLWGSLASALVLFAPGAVALGCVGPLAVECVQQRQEGHAGTAGGAVLCASTLGSLAGTFGTTHFLIPELGIALSFYLAAATLAALGLLTHSLSGRLGGGAALMVLATLGTTLAGEYRPLAVPVGTRVLESVQSPYQTVRVVETGQDETLRRQLQVNEGLDSFQSVWQPEPGLLGPGYYYNFFSLPAWLSDRQESWRVMVLGLGAGTAWRVLEGALPSDVKLVAHGVEIDPVVVELARRYMDLPEDDDTHRAWSGWDARAALTLSSETYDEIVLDTYANQMEIPAHLCSVEFFGVVLERLNDGGWLAINIGGFGVDDPVVTAIAKTAAGAFGQPALVVRVPFSRNCVAYLRKGQPLSAPADWLGAIDSPELAALTAPLELEDAWRLYEADPGVALTDDHNPIDALQSESIALAAAHNDELEALIAETRP